MINNCIAGPPAVPPRPPDAVRAIWVVRLRWRHSNHRRLRCLARYWRHPSHKCQEAHTGAKVSILGTKVDFRIMNVIFLSCQDSFRYGTCLLWCKYQVVINNGSFFSCVSFIAKFRLVLQTEWSDHVIYIQYTTYFFSLYPGSSLVKSKNTRKCRTWLWVESAISSSDLEHSHISPKRTQQLSKTWECQW